MHTCMDGCWPDFPNMTDTLTYKFPTHTHTNQCPLRCTETRYDSYDILTLQTTNYVVPQSLQLQRKPMKNALDFHAMDISKKICIAAQQHSFSIDLKHWSGRSWCRLWWRRSGPVQKPQWAQWKAKRKSPRVACCGVHGIQGQALEVFTQLAVSDVARQDSGGGDGGDCHGSLTSWWLVCCSNDFGRLEPGTQ